MGSTTITYTIGIACIVYFMLAIYPPSIATTLYTIVHHATTNLQPIAAKSPAVSHNSSIIPTTIDFTEDFKAMGYPDGRKIVRDSKSHLYVAYRKKYKLRYDTAYHIFVAKSTDNGHTWQVTNQGKPIEATGDTNQRVPAIAIDHHDVLHVVWYGSDDISRVSTGRSNQIKYVQSKDHGESWSEWRNIGYVEGYHGEELWQEHPTIYISQKDIQEEIRNQLSSSKVSTPGQVVSTSSTIYVVWEGRDPQYRRAGQIKFIKSTDSGIHWSTWKNVAPSTANHSRPTIVETPKGDLYILAYGRTNRRQQIIYTHSGDDGATWQQWASVSSAVVEQRHVSATVDNDGILHVVWRQQVPSLLLWQEQKTQIFLRHLRWKSVERRNFRVPQYNCGPDFSQH